LHYSLSSEHTLRCVNLTRRTFAPLRLWTVILYKYLAVAAARSSYQQAKRKTTKSFQRLRSFPYQDSSPTWNSTPSSRVATTQHLYAVLPTNLWLPWGPNLFADWIESLLNKIPELRLSHDTAIQRRDSSQKKPPGPFLLSTTNTTSTQTTT